MKDREIELFFTVWPIFKGGTPLGALVVWFNQNPSGDQGSSEFVEILGNLLGLFLDGRIDSPSSVGPAELSSRQLRILSLIAEGITNASIGRELSLSESSIKQETVKIFKFLGVRTGQQAANKGKAKGLIR